MQWNVPRVESTEVFSKNFVLIFLYKLKRVKKILNESTTIYDCYYEYTTKDLSVSYMRKIRGNKKIRQKREK